MFLGLVVEWGEAWVLVVATHTADGLVVLLDLVVVAGRGHGHFGQLDLGRSFSFFVSGAGAAAAEEGVVVAAGRGRGRVLRWLRGERSAAGGLLRRAGLGDGATRSLCTSRQTGGGRGEL
jgi:hypothetical protein